MFEVLTPGQSPVRQMVDPNGTLPYVELRTREPRHQADWFHRWDVDIMHQDEHVGYCGLILFHERQSMQFDLVTLNKTHPLLQINDREHKPRPKGLGLAVYVLAIETAHQRGMPFTSQGVELNPSSNKIWQILVGRNVAEVVQAPREQQYDDESIIYARYKAHVLSLLGGADRSIPTSDFDGESV